jgi:hypothetical protein
MHATGRGSVVARLARAPGSPPIGRHRVSWARRLLGVRRLRDPTAAGGCVAHSAGLAIFEQRDPQCFMYD